MNSGILASAGPPILVGLTVAALAAVHMRSARTRLLVEGALLLTLGGCFALWGASPLGASLDLAHRSNALWLRTLAVIWWLVGARFVTSLLGVLLGRDARSRQARLLSDLVAGAIYLTAALVVLNSVLGLQLKGLLATSGVIAVVLGLASQSTLADVFSGVAVGLDQPFRLGDRVSIGDQTEGVVVQVNWRSIRVQTDGEDIAIIPNSIVAKNLIINRSVPTPRRAASTDIISQSSARSETIIALIRQAALLSPALLQAPQPSIFLKFLGLRSTTFTVGYSVASSADLTAARGQLLRQARRLFRYAGLGPDPAPSASQLLGGLVLFETLQPEQIARLEAGLVPHRIEPEGLLFQQGDLGTSLYVVRSGVLEIASLDEATPTVFGQIGPGEYIGEVSMMSGNPHPVSAKALTICDVLELPRSALEILLDEDAALGEALERSVRKGLALLDRDSAARTAQLLDEGGTLLDQIGQFLRRRLSYSGGAGSAS